MPAEMRPNNELSALFLSQHKSSPFAFVACCPGRNASPLTVFRLFMVSIDDIDYTKARKYQGKVGESFFDDKGDIPGELCRDGK